MLTFMIILVSSYYTIKAVNKKYPEFFAKLFGYSFAAIAILGLFLKSLFVPVGDTKAKEGGSK
jgi:hypothetical protein